MSASNTTHACLPCSLCMERNIQEYCPICSPCHEALTVCDDCGATIRKPPILKRFEIVKLCAGCVRKRLKVF